MFEALLVDVNWLAVVVGAAAAFAVGMLWFSPKLFGRKWMTGVGLTPESKTPMMHGMLAQGVGTFLLAWVIGVTETTNAIALAILIALTISVLVKANGFWTNKSHYAIAVESGYILVMVIIMIAAHVII